MYFSECALGVQQFVESATLQKCFAMQNCCCLFVRVSVCVVCEHLCVCVVCIFARMYVPVHAVTMAHASAAATSLSLQCASA